MDEASATTNRFERHPLLAWVLILALFVLATEILLRLFKPEPVEFAKDFREVYRYHDRWYTDFMPATSTTIRLSDPNGGYHLNFLMTINNDGFRWHDRAADAPLPDATEQTIIHAIGDSFTMGWGVNYESSYPSRLEEALGDEYAVLNLGLNGYGTIGASEKSLEQLSTYPPAAVVYLFTENDYEDDAAATKHAQKPALIHHGYDLINALRRNTYTINLPWALRWWLYFRPQGSSGNRHQSSAQSDLIKRLAIAAASDPSKGQASKQALISYASTLAQQGVPLFVIAHGSGPNAADFASFSLELSIPTQLIEFDDALLLRGEGHFNRNGNLALAQMTQALLVERRVDHNATPQSDSKVERSSTQAHSPSRL